MRGGWRGSRVMFNRVSMAAAILRSSFREGFSVPFSIWLISPCDIPVKAESSFCVRPRAFLAAVIADNGIMVSAGALSIKTTLLP